MNSDVISNRYKILNPIGSGGMATVYLAQDLFLKRNIAIKIIHPHKIEDPTYIKRFNREVKIIANLDDTGIVPVYDFGFDRNSPYIVMRYMSGGSLAQKIKNKTLDLPETTKIVLPIAKTLNRLHHAGVIHRDIKPANILLDSDETPYLSDFGIAKVNLLSTMTGNMFLGTPHYMSPEQFKSSKEVTEKSDQYALGIMIYEMWVGTPPFTGDTPFQVMYQHISDNLPDFSKKNSKISIECFNVIQRMTAKSPNDRYPNVISAIQDLIDQSHLITEKSIQNEKLEKVISQSKNKTIKKNNTNKKEHINTPIKKIDGLDLLRVEEKIVVEAEDDNKGSDFFIDNFQNKNNVNQKKSILNIFQEKKIKFLIPIPFFIILIIFIILGSWIFISKPNFPSLNGSLVSRLTQNTIIPSQSPNFKTKQKTETISYPDENDQLKIIDQTQDVIKISPTIPTETPITTPSPTPITIKQLVFNPEMNPVSLQGQTPEKAVMIVDGQNRVHVAWWDDSVNPKGDIYVRSFIPDLGWNDPQMMNQPVLVPDKGFSTMIKQDADKNSLKLIHDTKGLAYLFFSGFPQYGTIYGGYYYATFEKTWSGIKQKYKIVGLDNRLVPTFGSDNQLHVFTDIVQPRIDWLLLADSFNGYGGFLSENTEFFIDNGENYHLFNKNSYLADRFSPKNIKLNERKWVVYELRNVSRFKPTQDDLGNVLIVTEENGNLFTQDWLENGGWGNKRQININSESIRGWQLINNIKGEIKLVILTNQNTIKVLDYNRSKWITEPDEYYSEKIIDSTFTTGMDESGKIYLCLLDHNSKQIFITSF